MVALQESAERLRTEGLSQEKSSNIKNKLKALQERRERIKDLSDKRREDLEISKLLCIFYRDVSEVQYLSFPVQVTLNKEKQTNELVGLWCLFVF